MRILIALIVAASLFASCEEIDVAAETQRAIANYEAENMEQALYDFSKVIDATDSCYVCHQYRAWIYRDQGRYEEALADCKRYIELNPTEAAGYANIGSVYYMLEDWNNALLNFKKALEISPELTVMYNTISHMLFATGQEEEGCIYYHKAIEAGYPDFDPQIVEACGVIGKSE